MKYLLSFCLILCLLLSGCGTLMDGNYLWVAPHQTQGNQGNNDNVQASNSSELINALGNLAINGIESGIIYVPQYDESRFETDMTNAVNHVLTANPIAAYAAETIEWELGANSGQRAVSVTITYLHNRTEIRKIRHVADVEQAAEAMYTALDSRDSGLVLYLNSYDTTDFVQLAEAYAFQNPNLVMEIPQVTANIYPQWGSARVVELKFSYQTSKDTLLSMQEQVTPIFSSAKLYVTENATDWLKYTQLYSFLMERYDYKIETSITPAYSLLCHGVGDSSAFATVFATMCREIGLECQVVNGTRQGLRWYWNLVKLNGEYYHVDLLHGTAFLPRRDSEMTGYVWDYSAYPATPA